MNSVTTRRRRSDWTKIRWHGYTCDLVWSFHSMQSAELSVVAEKHELF